jgi:hypothetical protein
MTAGLSNREMLDTLLQQYSSVRAEGTQALSGQLSALSLGTAALAVLLAGVASTWTKAPFVSCVGLMAVVPGATFFVLLVWATEVKKTLRASSFLRRESEPRINALFVDHPAVLTYESTGYRFGPIIPYYVAIAASLPVFAWFCYAAGTIRFERLNAEQLSGLSDSWWPAVFGVAFVLVPTVIGTTIGLREIRTNVSERTVGPAQGSRNVVGATVSDTDSCHVSARSRLS